MDKAALIEASKDSLNDDFEDREPVESFRAPLPDLTSIKFRTEGDKLTKDEKKLITHFQQLNNLRRIKKDLQAQVLKMQEEKKRKAEQEKTKKTHSTNNTNKLASAVQAKERAKLLLQSGAIKLPQARRANFIQHKRGVAQRNAGQKAGGASLDEGPNSPGAISPEHEDTSRKSKDAEETGPTAKRQKMNAGRSNLYENFVSGGHEGNEDKSPNSPQISDSSPSRLDSPRGRVGNVLFVRGCGLTHDFLTRAFQDFGPIMSIKVDKDKGQHAYVTLDKPESAKLATEKVNYFENTVLRVEIARKPSYRTPNNQNSSSRRDRSAETWSNLTARGRSNSDYRPKQEVPREMVTYEYD